MADTTTLVSALVRKVNAMGAPNGPAWLASQHEAALAAVLAGDEEITSLSFEGGSHSSKRHINAQELLQACEEAMAEIEGSGQSGPILPKFADIPR